MKKLDTSRYITVMSNEHMSEHQRRFADGLNGCRPVRFYKFGGGGKSRWKSKQAYAAYVDGVYRVRAFWVLAAIATAFIVFFSGCAERRDYGVQIVDRPVVNVPPVMRESNYYDTGSCVHATLITLLRWQGKEKLASDWRRRHYGGEYAGALNVKMDRRGIRYTSTTKGDVRFLEWACRTRRGCGITVKGGKHMITLVHLGREWAAVLDNNDTSKFIWIPRKKLIDEWKRSYGWAVTPVYSPMAPWPH